MTGVRAFSNEKKLNVKIVRRWRQYVIKVTSTIWHNLAQIGPNTPIFLGLGNRSKCFKEQFKTLKKKKILLMHWCHNKLYVKKRISAVPRTKKTSKHVFVISIYFLKILGEQLIEKRMSFFGGEGWGQRSAFVSNATS